LNLLRLVAWIVLLIIAVSIAYALFASREPYAYPPQQVPWTQSLLSLEQRLYCTDSAYVDPWTVVNFYGLSVEGGQIVFKYTNTAEEAEKVLSDASIDPELYYYYYSILTALVATPRGNYSTVYDLYPLPLSERDEEGLAGKSLCLFFPSGGFEVPPVRAALLSDVSYVVSGNTTVNIVAYLPTANISLTYSTSFSDPVLAQGYASAHVSVAEVERVLASNTTTTIPGVITIVIVDEVWYTRYSVSYNASFELLVNGSRHSSYTSSGSLTWTASTENTYTLYSAEWGSYMGFGPFTAARVEAEEYRDVEQSAWCDGLTCYIYTKSIYKADFSAEARSRGAVLYKAAIATAAERVDFWTGVLSTMRFTVDANGARLELPASTRLLLNTTLSAYPWEEKKLSTAVYLSDVITVAGSRLINFTRTVKVASINITISRPADPEEWGWGTAVELKPAVNITTWSIEKPQIDIEKVQKALKPNPGELWLEKLVLMYIHDIIKQFINSDSAMASYAQAFLWLLATQIPVNMGLCDTRGSSTPLLDALCKKCGSETERVEMLCNVTGYSLESWTKNASMHWPSYNGSTANTTICVAKISGYPSLWELYSMEKNIVYAKPVDGGYTVFYNIYENSPFGDWRRVKD